MTRHSRLFGTLVIGLLFSTPYDRLAQAEPIAACSGSGPAISTEVTVSSTARIISSVPAYNWYHGCGPTAAASVIGYWDLFGFPDLFDASSTDVFLTANVQDQISSPEHNAKYDPTPDAPGPAPAYTSIADWFQTSVGVGFGWSYLSEAESAFEGYAAFRGYQFDAQTLFGTFDWDALVLEIDSNRPFLGLVDTDGNGSTDHFVPVLGYDDRGSSGRFYGLYTTWSEDESIVWQPFQGLGHAWGLGYATFVRPVSEPLTVPEPSSWLFVAVGWSGLMAARLRRRPDRRRSRLIREPLDNL